MPNPIPGQAFGNLPDGLRQPLCAEYRSIVQHFLERKWRPSELSGGLFCEIVYTILDGHAKGTYAPGPTKPRDFVGACRQLEQNASEPRSFQVLIPRLLPALYEIRNNRNVGHTGGDVDPNHTDCVAVLAVANWIMGELVRVLHQLPSMQEAQAVVDALAERRTPIVWQAGDLKRVLDSKMSLPDQILVLLASSPGKVTADDLLRWTECSTKTYLKKLLRQLHSARKVNFDRESEEVTILPPGISQAESILSKYV